MKPEKRLERIEKNQKQVNDDIAALKDELREKPKKEEKPNKKEDKIKEGEWCHSNSTNRIIYCEEIGASTPTSFKGYGIGGDSCDFWAISCFRPATKGEVLETLKNEAKKRFGSETIKHDTLFNINGARINFSNYNNCGWDSCKYNNGIFEYHGLELFKDGKWAEIIIEDKLELNGNAVTIDRKKGEISIGCEKERNYKIFLETVSGLISWNIDTIHHKELGTISVSNLENLTIE